MICAAVTLGSLGQFSLAQLQATDAARAQLSQQPKGFVPGAVWKVLLSMAFSSSTA